METSRHLVQTADMLMTEKLQTTYTIMVVHWFWVAHKVHV